MKKLSDKQPSGFKSQPFKKDKADVNRKPSKAKSGAIPKAKTF